MLLFYTEMDTECMDYYEKQLYTVFKTYDVNNEEALSKSAVLDLCNTLQLEERGAALVETLFDRGAGAAAERVTFSHFRNGLLSVLGAQPTPTSARAPPPPPALGNTDPAPREVAPRFVFGSKKYGRRSRPASAAAATLSRVDLPAQEIPEPITQQPPTLQRGSRDSLDLLPHSDNSSSALGVDLDHDRLIDFQQSLALCRNLNMDGIDSRLIENIFRESSVEKITVGEFFDQLNTKLTMSIASTIDGAITTEEPSNDSDTDDGSDPEGGLTADSIIEAWERAGIEDPRRLWADVGGGSPRVRAGRVQRMLERGSPSHTHSEHLQLAAASLARLRLQSAHRRARAAAARADKLRADLADANRRAHALALEVDENHARIEASLKTRFRQAEVRHAEAARAAAAEWASEREKLVAAAARSQLEATEARGEEAKLRAEMLSRDAALEEAARRASLAELRATETEAARTALARRLAERAVEPAPEPPPVAPEPLLSELESLRASNKALRDRNDELCAALEAGSREEPASAAVTVATCWRDEVGDAAGVSAKPNEDADQSFASFDQKVVGHLEVTRRLEAVLASLTQVSLTDENGCESCGTLKSIITSIREHLVELSDSVIVASRSGLEETMTHAAVQTDQDQEVDKLKKRIAESNAKHRDEKEKLNNLVIELQNSLEQLKLENDKTEEYWSQKLDEEQKIYIEEQRISDERLSELFAKISEYEQQFANKNTNLPTIDERCSLELQFNDLEDEYKKYKKETELELENKEKEIDELNLKIKDIEAKLINVNSTASSPIDYLWNHQGTIQTPYKNDKRDYQNPAFKQCNISIEGNVRCSSDSERDKLSVNPIQRPALAARCSSVEGLRRDEADGPQMINCSELEGQLQKQAQGVVTHCAMCACLEARCRQLAAAARHKQLCLDAVQQAAVSDGSALRSRLAEAQGAAARLQARLAAADILVKELYVENCQLAHHQARLL